MKAIINNLRYDTETAEHLASAGNNLGYNDFNYYYEELYKTPNDNFFLVGEGGAMSHYSTPNGGGRSGDSNVFKPLTKTDVYNWLENNEEYELIEKYFSENIQDA